MKAQMKVTINKKPFQNIKFYKLQADTGNMAGYVFQDIGMDGSSIREKLERMQVWSAACYLIPFCIADIWQQALGHYYASCCKYYINNFPETITNLHHSLPSSLLETWIKIRHFWKWKHCWVDISQHMKKVETKMTLVCNRICFGSYSRWFQQDRRDQNLFCVDDHEEYYDCVTASDEAFALFTIKYYTLLPSSWKHQKHHTTIEDDTESGPPEEIETDASKDQASDSRRKKSKQKGKISKRKLNKALNDYKCMLPKNYCTPHTKLHDSHLKQVIANHCNTEQDKKDKEDGQWHLSLSELHRTSYQIFRLI